MSVIFLYEDRYDESGNDVMDVKEVVNPYTLEILTSDVTANLRG
jgi:hypothetical protein